MLTIAILFLFVGFGAADNQLDGGGGEIDQNLGPEHAFGKLISCHFLYLDIQGLNFISSRRRN